MNQSTYYCPISKSPLFLVSESFCVEFNNQIQSGLISDKNGNQMTDLVESLLVDNSADIVYPIRNGIPQLLPGLAVSLEGLNLGKPVD